MADNIKTGGRGNTGIAVLVGALVVAVVAIGFFLFGGDADTGGDINAQVPQTEQPAAPDTTGSTGGTGEPAPGGNQ